MQVTYYKFDGTPNRVDKTEYMTEVGTCDISNINRDIDLLNFDIVVNTSDVLYNANYCYVDVLNRYCYINRFEGLNGGATKIYCTIDVLYTYKDAILQSGAFVDCACTTYQSPQENFTPSNLPTYTNKTPKGKTFPLSPLSDNGDILLILSP